MSPYDRLLDKLLNLDEEYRDWDKPGGYKFGFHNPETSRATLYDVPHTPESHERLQRELAATGVRHRLIIEPLRSGYQSSNIHILDIDI